MRFYCNSVLWLCQKKKYSLTLRFFNFFLLFFILIGQQSFSASIIPWIRLKWKYSIGHLVLLKMSGSVGVIWLGTFVRERQLFLGNSLSLQRELMSAPKPVLWHNIWDSFGGITYIVFMQSLYFRITKAKRFSLD